MRRERWIKMEEPRSRARKAFRLLALATKVQLSSLYSSS
jgi:hypothetical protein